MDIFLRGADNGTTLEAVISSTGPYLAACTRSGTWRPSLMPSHGKAILFLGISYQISTDADRDSTSAPTGKFEESR